MEVNFNRNQKHIPDSSLCIVQCSDQEQINLINTRCVYLIPGCVSMFPARDFSFLLICIHFLIGSFSLTFFCLYLSTPASFMRILQIKVFTLKIQLSTEYILKLLQYEEVGCIFYVRKVKSTWSVHLPGEKKCIFRRSPEKISWLLLLLNNS